MNYVSAREGVPVPTKPYERAGRAEWVVCGCGHKGRPGAFHICIDLSEPTPIVAPKPEPVKKIKAKKTRRSLRTPWGGNSCECGKSIDVRSRQCRACMVAAFDLPECGTPEKYQWHRRQAQKDPENHPWPLPKEDLCGCRAAQREATRARKAQAA